MQPVHSYISSPTGPDTLNLTIVVHFGHLPSTLRDFLAGLVRVFLLLLPIHGQEKALPIYKLRHTDWLTLPLSLNSFVLMMLSSYLTVYLQTNTNKKANA
jgi:hypothetical protein